MFSGLRFVTEHIVCFLPEDLSSGIFVLKNPSTSADFEPTNFVFQGKRVTPRQARLTTRANILNLKRNIIVGP